MQLKYMWNFIWCIGLFLGFDVGLYLTLFYRWRRPSMRSCKQLGSTSTPASPPSPVSSYLTLAWRLLPALISRGSFVVRLPICPLCITSLHNIELPSVLIESYVCQMWHQSLKRSCGTSSPLCCTQTHLLKKKSTATKSLAWACLSFSRWCPLHSRIPVVF